MTATCEGFGGSFAWSLEAFGRSLLHLRNLTVAALL